MRSGWANTSGGRCRRRQEASRTSWSASIARRVGKLLIAIGLLLAAVGLFLGGGEA
jgi:hypothetical protein